jgi:hypothetical protein
MFEPIGFIAVYEITLFTYKLAPTSILTTPYHLDHDQAKAHLHDSTNRGNIFLAKDHFPKHMETLHVVFFCLLVVWQHLAELT